MVLLDGKSMEWVLTDEVAIRLELAEKIITSKNILHYLRKLMEQTVDKYAIKCLFGIAA